MTGQTFWELDGSILFDPITNEPILCNVCPCANYDCDPCTNYESDGTTIISDTAKNNLTLTYSGFSSGVCDDTYQTTPDDRSYSSNPWPGCVNTCELMNQPFTLIRQGQGGAGGVCQWAVNHDVCNIYDDAKQLLISAGYIDVVDHWYYWSNSFLYFKKIYFGAVQQGPYYWKLILSLYGQDWEFMWEKSVGNAWINEEPLYENCLGDAYLTSDDINPGVADCGEIGGCATFTASDLVSAIWLPNYGNTREDKKIVLYDPPVYALVGRFNGLSCPCDIGWVGAVEAVEYGSQTAGFWYEWDVKTTALPGSGLTAVITGW